jgi:hypothetical protein
MLQTLGQIFRPIRRINLAQLKNSPPSLPAQTTQRKTIHTSVANSRHIFRPIWQKNSAQLKKFGTFASLTFLGSFGLKRTTVLMSVENLPNFIREYKNEKQNFAATILFLLGPL